MNPHFQKNEPPERFEKLSFEKLSFEQLKSRLSAIDTTISIALFFCAGKSLERPKTPKLPSGSIGQRKVLILAMGTRV